jgi:hypothetical protein
VDFDIFVLLFAVPGKVRNLKIIPSAYSATVVWDSPLKPNGIIENYMVVYSLIGRVRVAESSTLLLTSDETSAGDEVSEALRRDGTEIQGSESTQAVETTEPITGINKALHIVESLPFRKVCSENCQIRQHNKVAEYSNAAIFGNSSPGLTWP